jgi:hypothetical protein
MTPSRPLLAALACLAIAACASKVETKENILLASGFRSATPTTPAQLALLKKLPPHRLAETTYKGATAWVYADPTICRCLYVGDRNAHDLYVKKVAQAKALDGEEAANARAAMASMSELGLDWQ